MENKTIKDIFKTKSINELLKNCELLNSYNCKFLKGENEKKVIYFGTDKKDEENVIYIKQLFIKSNNMEKERYKQIYKELYLLFSLKNFHYFPQNVEKIFSNNEEFCYILFKENCITLKHLIIGKNLLTSDLIKWIVYQITFGLYILHYNGIIHYDIKPSNIVINKEGGVSISDFDSSIYKKETPFKYFTSLSYASPEFLIEKLNNKIIQPDEKYDMWGLGITMIELLQKDFLFKDDYNIDEKAQLKDIISQFGINVDYTDKDLIKELSENKNIKFKIDDQISNITEDDEAKDLLKKLIIFNPKERLSAKEVLNSDYLKQYKNLDSLSIQTIPFPNDYSEICKDNINPEKFLDLIRKIN